MLGLLNINKLFDTNNREIKKLAPIVTQINALEPAMKKLKVADFKKKTLEFKKRIADGESVYLLLPEAFALAREASNRAIGLRHHDVQLMAATVLAQGKVAEQKTGEGKTLSAVPALYLHALTGKPVHLVTVNDYLARRDAGWMATIFDLLGITVSSMISEQSFKYDTTYTDESARDYRLVHLKPVSRQEAYQCDVVYGINSEFGFDYLRDNMAQNIAELRQRGYYFAVIDEVDSVLIDEARTPHIMSAPDETPSQKYYEYAKMVDNLEAETDYKIDEKARTAHLTDHGIEKVEKMYNVTDIYEKDFDTVYHIEAALKANTLFHKDRDYIVRDTQVILVDEFTGRLMEGRRLSEGLHQAIEAKEGVQIQQESKTLATVSLQNYFRMYEKLAGMTGTAATEAEEFHKIYGLDVVVIPTHRVMQRIDQSDAIYKTTPAKINAIVDEIAKAHKIGQPVLVGTTSIDKNEAVSEYLKKRKIPHEILNAKNHEREALIIKDAGRRGAVTVATNMAGRGVDIILGGQMPNAFAEEYEGEKGAPRLKKDMDIWQKEHDAVIDAGGLLVIGTEKHESRRIDNQLRGRSGRQGDPGRSIFIVSLDDDLMRIFGGDSISGLMTRFNFPEDQPLSHGLVSRVIEQAQVKVEGYNFEIRKNLLNYDDVLNRHREIIYSNRRSIVAGTENIEELTIAKVRNQIAKIVAFNFEVETQHDHYQSILEEFCNIIQFDDHSKTHLAEQLAQKTTPEEITEFLSGIALQVHKARVEQFGEAPIHEMLKLVSLATIDNLWMEHLTSIEDLRTGIGLRGYGQRDPLIEYKNESFNMFERLVAGIDDGIVTRIFKVNIVNNIGPLEDKPIMLNQPEAEIGEKAAAERKPHRMKNPQQFSSPNINQKHPEHHKLSRNDPCWCGSGKKWKKCHYPNLG